MATATEKNYYHVGVLLFPGVDILDFAGPIEVLSHALHNHNPDSPDRMFTFDTIARTSLIRAANCLTLKVDVLLDEARKCLSQYDILIVPGGPPSVIQLLAESSIPEVQLIRAYASLPATLNPQRPRILFSICTGALLVGATGLLSGLTVTTHHRALDTLQQLCARFGGKDRKLPEVVFKRYVDGGFLEENSLRVITAGGVSSGLDASFYLVRLLTDSEMVSFISRVMEYDWKQLN
ncbi:Isonitrile hydratase-like protein xanA [Penicillium oxalicum]|uniref:DJ-1/PfpI domain-containing protein n=1 Tax=Penicillium oxalicum (strain 114-2 / CGMCC 5302) TaxID=933388 RepID=S7ZWV2_PENO1|nr:Isonitrile hydratase-like protein xanA [Penicillium oxalicum]EPS34919.1 hypothetical protein PDE_09883 [Penicillium oxalicum 114-2]KAI2793533.1 Isonitrile hydratase-like protein xanA [Penicillium oxalicum]